MLLTHVSNFDNILSVFCIVFFYHICYSKNTTKTHGGVMKGYNKWSYSPYKPLLYDVGDIYICRIVPYENSIRFEWLKGDFNDFEIFYRKRNDGDFIKAGQTREDYYIIENLTLHTDYEFYVASNGKKSRVRLARTGESVGNVVNYLHPDDEAYAFSGRYLCSPSLVRHPDGYLLSSMDVYASGHPQNLTFIFRSDDNGKNWKYVSELMPCFWGKLFIHNNEVYMLAISTEYGDLLISKSTDGAKSFLPPVCLLRGSNGKNGNAGWHKNPQNVFVYNDRIYTSIEWGSWDCKDYFFASSVISCSTCDDLLVPENWSISEPRKFDRFSEELKDAPVPMMTIEGTIVLSPENKLLNVMRFGVKGKALAYEINTQNPDAPLSFYRTIPFPAHMSKFMIKYDEVSKKYYSVATRIYDWNNLITRNLLSLMVSSDLYNWQVATDIFDYRHEDSQKVGFQYVDFEFDGDDIIFLCRTALNDAHTFHDSNYQTFHRIKNFRNL